MNLKKKKMFVYKKGVKLKKNERWHKGGHNVGKWNHIFRGKTRKHRELEKAESDD